MIRDKLSDYPDYNYKSLDTLRHFLLKCGFKHKKPDNRMVIMESQRTVALREDYLQKIGEYHQLNRNRNIARNIEYLDKIGHNFSERLWIP